MARTREETIRTYLKGVVCVVLFSFALLQGVTFAEGISGSMELGYSAGNSTSNTIQGASTKSTSELFQQRYRLFYNRNLFPNLRWNVGGTVEKTATTTRMDGADSEGTNTRVAPSTDLLLSTPFVSAGIGFSKIEEKQDSGGSSTTAVRDVYFASLGLRPSELPSLNISFQHADTYDKDHTSADRMSDTLALSSRYSPLRGLDLGYQGNYSSVTDKLTNFRVDTESHSGRISYAGQLLQNRVSLSTSYNITQFTTETISSGGGEVSFQEFPATGMSAIDDLPATAVDDALAATPDLINNVANTGPTSLNFNIGFLDGLDTRTRNFGLDFGVGNDKEINTLYVSVSDAVNISSVADFFSWEVYVSTDTADAFALRHWTQQPVTAVSFNPFDRRFEIKFQNVKTRLIKAVTHPLPAAAPLSGNISYKNIFVTELQAFIRKSAADLEKKSVQVSQTYDLNVRTRLFNSPLLFHDLYYWLAETNSGSASRHILSNGLSLTHTFNRIFSGGARVAVEESSDQAGNKTAYLTSASLRAVPLKTLSHNLVFSSRDEEREGQKSNNRSVFLNNLLEVYQGMNLILSEGVSSSTSETGQTTDSTTLTYGANIVPHRTLSASLYLSDSKTTQSGGGKSPTESSTQRSDLSLAYRPFETVYLSYAYGILKASGREPSTVQSYGIAWSPFPDGAIQFNIAYAESLLSDNASKTSFLTPSMRWRLNSKVFLTLSYLASKSESALQTSETRSFDANVTVTF